MGHGAAGEERPSGGPLGRLAGFLVDAGACPYLPGRSFHAFHASDPVDIGLYRVLLDHRFRRNGGAFYAPMCPGCNACRPVRVAVAGFQPRRDQRRTIAANADLDLTWHPRGLDDERLALWRSYQREIHQDPAEDSPERFLCSDGGIPGGELHARDRAGRLLGVAVCDLIGDAWSSVYCYWEPEARSRGLGTYLAIAEIRTAHARGLRWWYPGFWVSGCAKMAYKARFGPAEVLVDGAWRPLSAGGGG